jgi:enoyl-CoA hydratase
MAGTIHQQRLDGGVVLLELDNPPMNAMGAAMLAQMAEVMTALGQDLGVRAIVLTGRGTAFCSGADLKEAAARDQPSGPEDLGSFGRVLDLVAGSRPPVIAAINGHCVGGGFELALSCDIRIASRAAKFVCAGVNVGLMASSFTLPRLIGVSRAKAMLLTGLPHDAATAEAWGVVTAVHEPDALVDAALTLAQRIASRAPLAVEASKRAADRALDMSPQEIAEALRQGMGALRRSEDHKEAVAAFAAKREPVFRRR